MNIKDRSGRGYRFGIGLHRRRDGPSTPGMTWKLDRGGHGHGGDWDWDDGDWNGGWNGGWQSPGPCGAGYWVPPAVWQWVPPAA